MRYQSLADYIATLSESEKEQYKHLIEQSQQRDLVIKKNCDELRKKLEGLLGNMDEIVKTSSVLEKSVVDLKVSLLALHSKALSYAKTGPIFEQCNLYLFQHYPKSLN